MPTNDPLGQGNGKPLLPSFDPVQGAEELLTLNAAFKNYWPAIRCRIADRASAMFACYEAIAKSARTGNRIGEEAYATVSEVILLGQSITAAFYGDAPPLQNDWGVSGDALAEALNLTAEALGLAAGEATP